jgi:probable HAF family extracellular repeat protein
MATNARRLLTATEGTTGSVRGGARRRRARALLAAATGCLVVFGAGSMTVGAQFWPRPISNTYTLVNLGASTIWSFGYAINASGQAVGDMDKPTGYSQQAHRAFRTAPNQPVNPWNDDLGVLPGHWRSYAFAIDNNGVVVGDSVYNSAYIQTRAFRYGYNGAAMEDLHGVPGAVHSYARGLNDYGWIVGHFTDSWRRSHAMLSFGPNWSYAIASWLGNPAESVATDINNRDQIVGWRKALTSSQPMAYLFDAAANVWRRIDLGTLPGGIWSTASGLNDYGQVVGQSDKWVGAQRWTHAFAWQDANGNGISDPGEMRDLDTMGTPFSAATGINNYGVAVGYYGDPHVIYGNSRACIFQANGQMVDLNTQIPAGTGWTLRAATGINDQGQIVGWMQDQNGNFQAFRLDPPPSRIILF